jgi:streptogramin lyase
MRLIWTSVLAACAPRSGGTVLGDGAHDLGAVAVREVTGLPAPHDCLDLAEGAAPQGLAFGPDGHLWVADAGLGRVNGRRGPHGRLNQNRADRAPRSVRTAQSEDRTKRTRYRV